MYPIIVIFVPKNPLTLFFRTWEILRENVTKPGCIIVTVPSLEEATLFNNKVRLPIGTQRWLCIIINKNKKCLHNVALHIVLARSAHS